MKPCTGADGAPLRIAVNISGHQFKQSHFTDLVDRILRETGLSPERLELELTENILMDGVDDTVRILRELKGRGIRLSIDDFGTGYSSLNYLKHFPMDRIKIDRSFLGEVREAQDSGAIIGAITAMAHSLRMKVVAEGVESREQLDFLRRCRCDEAQGFLLSPPLSAAEFFDLLAQPTAPPAWGIPASD
jgi:EAL domain-containing protein (putative c-di-GMP-specific phosphodiesterase class I)